MPLCPFFSVVIPTFNREKTILNTIQSVLEQTFTDFEILVIDDGSTDDTSKTLGPIQDSRFSYHKIEASGGPARPRNIGVQKAQAKWICFLDSDDFWFKNKLETIHSQLINHPQIDFIFHGLNVLGEGSREIHKKIPLNPVTKPVYKSILLNCYNKTIPTSTVTVKKDLLQQVGGFNEDPSYVSMEDFDLWVRISKVSDHFKKCDIVLGNYYVSPDSITTYNLRRWSHLEKIITENLDKSKFSNRELIHIQAYLIYSKARVLQLNHAYRDSLFQYVEVLKLKVFKTYSMLTFLFILKLIFLIILKKKSSINL